MKAQKKAGRKRTAVVAAQPARSRRWLWYAIGIFVLAYVGFQAYGAVLNGPFIFDDSYLLFRAPNPPQELRIWVRGIRPLLNFSYWINYRISPTDTLWYHIYNVLFHIINSFLAFLIVRRFLRDPRARAGEPDEARDLLLAAFAGGLFLLHPVQTESVAYVASRSENMSVMFLLAALALFLYRGAAKVSWRIALGVLVLYGAAVAVKEHTAALIGVLLLTDFYWNPGFSFAGIKRNWRLYVPIGLVGCAGALFVITVLRQSTTAGFNIKEFTWYQYFFTECRAFWTYLRVFFLPYGQNVDYVFPISRSITDHGAIFGLIGILILTALAVRFAGRYRLASYGFFLYVLLLAPTSSFIPIQDPVAERRLYLPMIGMLLMVTDLVQRVPLKRQVMAVAMAVVLLIAGVLTYQRSLVWTSNIALWQDVVQKAPQNGRAHFQLASALHNEAGRCDLALDEYAAAYRIYGPRYDLFVDWAEALDCANKTDEALDKLRKAAALEPQAHVYMEIGKVAANHQRYGEALEAFAQAEKMDPNYVMTFVNRGTLYKVLRQYPQALENYQRALQIDPANELAARGVSEVQRLMARQR